MFSNGFKAQIPSPQPSSRLGGERESRTVSRCIRTICGYLPGNRDCPMLELRG
jgi:hypothetical protein